MEEKIAIVLNYSTEGVSFTFTSRGNTEVITGKDTFDVLLKLTGHQLHGVILMLSSTAKMIKTLNDAEAELRDILDGPEGGKVH